MKNISIKEYKKLQSFTKLLMDKYLPILDIDNGQFIRKTVDIPKGKRIELVDI